MGVGKIKINLGCSRQTENLEVPDFQYDMRLRRRWKRRCIANEMMKHNYHAHATRKNVGSCGNAAVNTTENRGHMAEEEVDEDYKFFLDNFVFHIDVSSDSNVGCSEVDVNSSHSDDNWDPQYKMFLENLREDGNSYIFEVFADNQLFHVKYEGQEEERLHDLVNTEVQCHSVDEDYQLYLNSSRIEGDSLVYMPERAIATKYGWSESDEKSSMVRQNLQVPNVATEPPNTRRSSDDYHVAKHKCNSEALRDIVDEDYQLFLNSVSRVGDSLVYMPENGVTEVYEEENDRCSDDSEDSEPIVLEPSQYYENSPFICSKSYDSSWLGEERNHRDSLPFYAFDPSPYRKGLMENLERPYDQNEYDKLLHEACCQRTKERHREMRGGVIKSCPLGGVNKSNLELYSDLAKAIDEVKEPRRVLFLLRGFFYWMEHVTQVGAFRPWLDQSCLDILQKMYIWDLDVSKFGSKKVFKCREATELIIIILIFHRPVQSVIVAVAGLIRTTCAMYIV